MKAKLISLLAGALLFCTPLAKAQVLDGGIVGGISTGSVRLNGINTPFVNRATGNTVMGYEGGGFARIHIGSFYIKPMAMLDYHQGALDLTTRQDALIQSNFTYGRLVVPLLAGFHFPRIFSIEAGPACSWLYHTDLAAYNNLNVERTGLGYRAGIHAEYGLFSWGFVYQGMVNQGTGFSNTTLRAPDEVLLEIGINLAGRK